MRPAGLRVPVGALALCLALGPAACIQNDGSRNPLGNFGKVSVYDERSLGYEADQTLQDNLVLIEDALVLSMLNDLGQSLVATLGEQPFTYRFRVLVDPSLNAFALPGGAIYFHTGTILNAGSLDELAGVMAHEIAHVKAHHYARRAEAAAIPGLLAQLAGVLATAATGQAEPLVIAQGVNVALQLSYTREHEAEADTLGATFMARAGYDPLGAVRFFERLMATRNLPSIELPPYLYSHPAVESRIEVGIERAERLTVTGTRPPDLDRAFRAAQFRLAQMVELRRTELKETVGARDPAADALLARAAAAADQGDTAAALANLEQAGLAHPADPRIWFRQGELLAKQERHEEAVVAFRRALRLDPEVALNYYHLGLAHKELGHTVQATFYLEQAARRFEGRGNLPQRAQATVRRLIFPVVGRAGLADGARTASADTPAGRSREAFDARDDRVTWWAWVEPDYIDRRDEIQVRWIDPSGSVVDEGTAARLRRPQASAELLLTPELTRRHGIWRVEASLDDEVVDRRTFRMTPVPRP